MAEEQPVTSADSASTDSTTDSTTDSMTDSTSAAHELAATDEAPAEEAPADEAPADEAPAEEAPAEEAAAAQAPVAAPAAAEAGTLPQPQFNWTPLTFQPLVWRYDAEPEQTGAIDLREPAAVDVREQAPPKAPRRKRTRR